MLRLLERLGAVLLHLAALPRLLRWLHGLRLQHLHDVRIQVNSGLLHIVDRRTVATALSIDLVHLLLVRQQVAHARILSRLLLQGLARVELLLVLHEEVADLEGHLLVHVGSSSLCILSYRAAVNWRLEV